jgi:hypothetical protein
MRVAGYGIGNWQCVCEKAEQKGYKWHDRQQRRHDRKNAQGDGKLKF